MTRTKQLTTTRHVGTTPHSIYVQKLHNKIRLDVNALSLNEIYRLADLLSLTQVTNPTSGRRISMSGPTYQKLQSTMSCDEIGDLLRKEIVTYHLRSIERSEGCLRFLGIKF